MNHLVSPAKSNHILVKDFITAKHQNIKMFFNFSHFVLEELFSELELGIQYNVIVKKEVHIFTSWGVKPMLPESLVRALKKYIPPPFPPSIVEVFSTMR